MSDGLHRFTVRDAVHGKYDLLMAIPREEEPWGVLAPLKGTVWGSLVRQVSGEALATARYGLLTPLARELRTSPKHLAQQVPDAVGMCSLTVDNACAGATNKCRPGPKLPDCYQPFGTTPEMQTAIYNVAIAWRENRHVIVVIGDEFVIR